MLGMSNLLSMGRHSPIPRLSVRVIPPVVLRRVSLESQPESHEFASSTRGPCLLVGEVTQPIWKRLLPLPS